MSFIQNIVGFVKKSSFSKIGRSDTLNMYVEKKDQSEHGFAVVLKPMPGYKKVCDIPGAPRGTFRCSRSFDGKPAVYGVWGDKLYLIVRDDEGNFSPVEIGLVSGEGRVSFCETNAYGNNIPRLIVCDGINVYAVPMASDPMVQQAEFKTIALPFKYPGSTTERIKPSWVASMYNYLIVGAEGTDMFYYSYQFPFETGDDDVFEVKNTGGVGNYVMSEWQPDNTIAGVGNGSRLFTLGEKSFQVFTYQSSVDMPFASPDTASQSIGIKNKDSLAQYGGSIFWLGSADMGNGSIYTMGADASPVRISTDEIEEMIAGYDCDNLESFVMKIGSHPLYVINFKSNKQTLAYDVKEEGWIRLSSRDTKGNEGSYRYKYAVISVDGKLWLQYNGGLAQTTTEDWYEHDGTPIIRKRVGGVISSEHQPFKIPKVQLITNNGDYPLVKGRPAKVTMRYSRNGTTFQEASTRSLGSVGQYDYDTVFKNLGKAKHFIIELGTSENIPFALYGIDIKAIKCGN